MYHLHFVKFPVGALMKKKSGQWFGVEEEVEW